MLSSDAGGIQLQFFQVRIAECFGQPLPDICFAPAIEAPPDTVPMTEAFRQVSPGDACFCHEKHGIDEEAIVFAALTAISFFASDQRFDFVPLRISEFMSSWHLAPP